MNIENWPLETVLCALNTQAYGNSVFALIFLMENCWKSAFSQETVF